MKLKSISINNYKSLGETKTKLNFDKDLVILVGKNEAGKSNILNAIEGITFMSDDIIEKDIYIDQDRNRVTDNPVELVFDFISNQREETIYTITFKEREGTYSQYFSEEIEFELSSPEVEVALEEFRESIINAKKYERNFTNHVKGFRFGNIISTIEKDHSNYAKKFLLPNIDFWSKIDALERSLSQGVVRDSLVDLKRKHKRAYSAIENRYEMFKKRLPKIIKFEEFTLKDRYTFGDLQEEFNNNGPIARLLLGSKITSELIEKRFNCTSDKRRSVQEKINFLFERNFSKKFKSRYGQDSVSIVLDFDDSGLGLLVCSNDEYYKFALRSEGFKYYLSLFSEMLYYNHDSSLILIDEPGTKLHIDAKREILQEFHRVVDGGNQLVFTTHSPFLIDSNKLEHVQLVEKNDELTRISRNFYISPFEGNSITHSETLTPLVKAIGYSLQNSIEPNRDKVNLVVEGITDYFYLKAMLNVVDLEEQLHPHIIPSIGASQEHLIVSILIGWGYKVKSLFDNDSEGRREYEKLKKLFIDDFASNVFFNNECDCIDENKCSCNKTIESLLSESIVSQLESSDKTLMAKEFNTKVGANSIEIDRETKQKFKNLFLKVLV